MYLLLSSNYDTLFLIRALRPHFRRRQSETLWYWIATLASDPIPSQRTLCLLSLVATHDEGGAKDTTRKAG
jgi:hypothetical protein